MAHPRPAVHRTIIVVDVERFGDARRTNPHQVAVRDGLWHALEQAFGAAGIRMAVHAGEVCRDARGVAGAAVNAAFRLLEAEPLKRALASSSGVLAVIASQWFFEEVIRHTPARYRRVHVSVKETSTTGPVRLPRPVARLRHRTSPRP